MLRWLRSIDWAAIVGSGLFLAFLLIVVGSLAPLHPSQGVSAQGSGDVLGWIIHHVEVSSTVVIAVFTVALVVATVGLWLATNKITRDAKEGREHIERAYVSMSHKTPPALKIDETRSGVVLYVKVRDTGRTPAYVTDVVLKCAIGNLPSRPDTVPSAGHNPTNAYLVTDADIIVSQRFGIHPDTLQKVLAEETPLWIYGHVDYIDVFGNRYRGGYMRKYDRYDNSLPPLPSGNYPERENNLIFDKANGYNYDRRRKPGEGNDWDMSVV